MGSLVITLLQISWRKPSVKEFRNSLKIWQSYSYEFGAPFFETRCIFFNNDVRIWQRTTTTDKSKRSTRSSGNVAPSWFSAIACLASLLWRNSNFQLQQPVCSEVSGVDGRYVQSACCVHSFILDLRLDCKGEGVDGSRQVRDWGEKMPFRTYKFSALRYRNKTSWMSEKVYAVFWDSISCLSVRGSPRNPRWRTFQHFQT